jgi:hypothetical protein
VSSHQIDAGTRQEVAASSWAPTHYSHEGTPKKAIAKYPTQAAEVELGQLLSAAMELTEENVEQVNRQSADQAGPRETKTSKASGKL